MKHEAWGITRVNGVAVCDRGAGRRRVPAPLGPAGVARGAGTRRRDQRAQVLVGDGGAGLTQHEAGGARVAIHGAALPTPHVLHTVVSLARVGEQGLLERADVVEGARAEQVAARLAHGTRHTTHVARHTSHVTRYTSRARPKPFILSKTSSE